MNKIYYSPSGNRRVYVKIGEKSFTRNGQTVIEPDTVRCQFGDFGPGRFATDDERVQAALEAHPTFNREFIAFEGEAAKLLANAKTLKEAIPDAKQIAAREEAVREAKALKLNLDLVKLSTADIQAAVSRHKIELEAKMEVLVAPPEVPEAPQVKEMPVAKEALQADQYRDRLASRRGRKPKASLEAEA